MSYRSDEIDDNDDLPISMMSEKDPSLQTILRLSSTSRMIGSRYHVPSVFVVIIAVQTLSLRRTLQPSDAGARTAVYVDDVAQGNTFLMVFISTLLIFDSPSIPVLESQLSISSLRTIGSSSPGPSNHQDSYSRYPMLGPRLLAPLGLEHSVQDLHSQF